MHKLAYKAGHTPLHQLYPLIKFTWLIIGSVMIVILSNSFLLFITASTFLITLHLIYPAIWKIRGFQFVLATGLLLLIIYLVFDKSGRIVFSPGFPLLNLTTGGLNNGLRISFRYLSIVFMSYLFILTTEPNQLAYSFMKTGISYRYGFMLVTALRLAPFLEEEGRTIYRAQLVRGIHYDRGKTKKLILIVQQFLTPLLISALRRADKLVFSMEGRGFGKYPQRTFRNQMTPSRLDLWISIGLLLVFTILIFINFGA